MTGDEVRLDTAARTTLASFGTCAGAVWVWHAAVMYELAPRQPVVHAAAHATFVVTAALFWRLLLGPRGAGRQPNGGGILLVFTMAVQSVLLAALLTFAPPPRYPTYAVTAPAFGMDALSDQRLAGAIMWVPAGLLYVAVGSFLLARWERIGDVSAVRVDGRRW